MTSLASGFFRAAERAPEKTAIVIGGSCTSYGRLASAVGSAADLLATLPLSHESHGGPHLAFDPGRTIALAADNTIDVAVWYLTCVATGYQLLLMDPLWSEGKTQDVLKAFKPLALVGEFSAAVSRENCAPVLSLAACWQVEAQPEFALSGLLESQRDLSGATFLIGFTSGSSGAVKAFFRQQQSWLESFTHSQQEFALQDSNQVLAPGPLSHGLSFYSMAETLNSGATFYSMPGFDLSQCLKILEQQPIDTMVVVPTMLERLMSHLRDGYHQGFKPRRLHRIISAGAKLSPRVAVAWQQQVPELIISEYYGASEMSFVSVAHTDEGRPAGSVGRAFHGVEIAIVDDTGSKLDIGKHGRVVVKSSMLALGYLVPSQAELPTGGTAVSQEPHSANSEFNDLKWQPLDTLLGWTGVGDRGYIDRSGNLFLLDRADRQVTVGGLNVQPSVIEEVLVQCTCSALVCVVAVPNEQWGWTLVAVIESSTPLSGGRAALITCCASTLLRHEIPRIFYRMDRMPLTSSGKIAYLKVLEYVTERDLCLTEVVL